LVNDRVCIVIASHDGERTVARALRSAFAQECQVIVVDDGSTDATSHIATTSGAIVHRLATASGGPARPRNIGAHLTHAPYLMFLDDDDELLTSAVALLLAVAESPRQPAVVYGDVVVREPDGSETAGSVKYGVMQDPLQMLDHSYLPILGALVRRDWFERVGGFSTSLAALEDWHFWLKIALSGGQFEGIADVVGIYHKRPGSRNADPERLAETRVAVARDLLARFPNHQDRLAVRELAAERDLPIARFWIVANRLVPRRRLPGILMRALIGSPIGLSTLRTAVASALGPGRDHLRRR